MDSSSEFAAEVGENQKNVNKIRCKFCNSLVLSKDTASYVKEEFSLPLIQQKKNSQPENLEKETFSEFWTVDDMFTFDNVGFSNTLGIYKFLICADCEMGPIGYHNLESKKSFVALARIKHGD